MSSSCISVSTTPRGTLHMAAGADLVADDGDTFFAARHQAVVVAENRRRDFGAQFRDAFFRVRLRRFVEFERLKFQKIFNDVRS